MELLLADLIVAVHLGIVLFVLLGQLLVLGGWALGWAWVRGPRFRLLHFFTIAWVAVQGALGQTCPLTVWEHQLRAATADGPEGGSFVGRLLHDILFVDVPQATLNRCYVGFALLVLVTLVGCRPRWSLLRRKPDASGVASSGAP